MLQADIFMKNFDPKNCKAYHTQKFQVGTRCFADALWRKFAL